MAKSQTGHICEMLVTFDCPNTESYYQSDNGRNGNRGQLSSLRIPVVLSSFLLSKTLPKDFFARGARSFEQNSA